MKSVDYKCIKCKKKYEKTYKDQEKILSKIICKNCKNDCIKIFSAPGIICHQGKCGNAKNGYASNPISIKKT